MKAINLSLKQREQLGINYVSHDDVKVKQFKLVDLNKQSREIGIELINSLVSNDNPFNLLQNIEDLSEINKIDEEQSYTIDFEKIRDEISKDNLNFKGVTMSGISDFKIDESTKEHFTQILYIIHQNSYIGNKWIGWEEPFKIDDLHTICRKNYRVYINEWERKDGMAFVAKFPKMIDYFVIKFCKKV